MLISELISICCIVQIVCDVYGSYQALEFWTLNRTGKVPVDVIRDFVVDRLR